MAAENRRRVKLNYLAIIKVLIFLVAVILAVVLLTVIVKRAADDTSTPPSVSSPQESGNSAVSQPETSENENSGVIQQPNYQFINVDNSKIYTGNLVLVNNNYGFSFEDIETQVQSMAETKTKDYFVSDRNVLLQPAVTEKLNELMAAFRALKNRNDAMVTTGYVTYDSQSSKYSTAVTKYGEDQASTMVAKPGGADAHTGLSVEFRLYTDGKFYVYDGTGDFEWIAQNAHKFGFILRYPANKEMTTGMDAAANKFRYVGVPHSTFIFENDLALEEYIITVKNYRYNTAHWNCEVDGVMYEVYYAPADEGSSTDIPVPSDKIYTISGNNVDGFIITVKNQ